MLTQAARRFSTTVRASLRASLMEEQVTKTRRNGVGIVVWKHIVMEIRGRKRWIAKNTEKRREHRQERARRETACPLTIRPTLTNWGTAPQVLVLSRVEERWIAVECRLWLQVR